ncbi:MAG: sigma-54 dependent transcriptional regulator [Firmicutes bacterium]|nr:sigma-54 dependent transcriptional regulator [Bacillota bacterium]
MVAETRLLIADDEADFRGLLVQRYRRRGYKTVGASDGLAALQRLEETNFHLAIFDLKMPGLEGIELLRRSRELQPDLQVIILTGHGTVATAIEAMKLGAYDFLEKPCDLAELDLLLSRAAEKGSLVDEVKGWREIHRRQNDPGAIIGQSEGIQMVLAITRRAALSDLPVLIEGESGTGKELVAQALHHWGKRAGRPYVAVNAAAFPETLLESELFGHERGAFSGATATKMGLVEAANGGTLFLDEVGEMPPALQVKLLRFLETGEFRHLGDTRLKQVDVRILAATNRDLKEQVRRGEFRLDLFYRLATIRLSLPPLRERREDIPLLIEYFLDRLGGGEKKILSSAAREALLSYDFPGNVRELRSMLERAVLMSRGRIIEKEELLGRQSPSEVRRPAMSLEELERTYINEILTSTGGNKSQAAKILGISLRNLYRKLGRS